MDTQICTCSHRGRWTSRAALVLAALSLVTAGTGTAVAATGGTFVLGRPNTTTTPTNLTNTNGTALGLTSKAGTPSLFVSNTVKVGNFNADLLDGLDSTAFALKSKPLAPWSGYSVMVAGTTCPPGTSSVTGVGRYGAED